MNCIAMVMASSSRVRALLLLQIQGGVVISNG
jgi:hypothetical protein